MGGKQAVDQALDARHQGSVGTMVEERRAQALGGAHVVVEREDGEDPEAEELVPTLAWLARPGRRPRRSARSDGS